MNPCATIKFDEEGVTQLYLVLCNLRTSTFDLTQRGKKTKTVILIDVNEEGLATLADFDFKTGEAKVGADPFHIDLYKPGVSLTYC